MGTLRVNGIGLERWTVTRGTFYRPPVTVRRFTVDSPGVHGTTALGLPVFEEPSVTIELAPHVQGGTEADLEALTADLTSLLTQPALTVSRHTEGRVEEAPAVLVSLTPSDEFIWGRHARYTAVLAVPGVFLRDEDFTSSALLSQGTHTLATLTGTAPINDAIVRCGTGGSNYVITDLGSGTSVTYTPSLGSGNYVYLDPANARAWRTTSASAWSFAGTDVTADMDYGTGGPLQLWPVGYNPRSVQVSVNFSGSVMIRARRAWL